MDKEIVRMKIERNRKYLESCDICPFGKTMYECVKECYQMFYGVNRLKLELSDDDDKCPCSILDKDYVIARTNEWLKED